MKKKNNKDQNKVSLFLKIFFKKKVFELGVIGIIGIILLLLYYVYAQLCNLLNNNPTVYFISVISFIFIIVNVILTLSDMNILPKKDKEGNSVIVFFITFMILIFIPGISSELYENELSEMDIRNPEPNVRIEENKNLIGQTKIQQVCYDNIPQDSRLWDNETYPISFDKFQDLENIGGVWCHFNGGSYDIGDLFYMDRGVFLKQYNKK